MYWEMTRRCNFDCPYCFRKQNPKDKQIEDSVSARFDAEHIARQFDNTGKSWMIYMTGGEPLLYPNFVALAGALARNHYMSMSTNLSTTSACELADTVGPQRFTAIRANVHITEREKINDGLKEFLRKFLYFQNLGFDIRLVYVAYPPLFSRIKQDIESLREKGVKNIELKIFQGKLDGRRFPRDYTAGQRDFLLELGLSNYEKQILDSRVSFLGKLCRAGRLAFVMDPAGSVSRCNTLDENYGNLFEGTFKPGKSTRRCPARKCACAYQGFSLASAGGSSVPSKIVVQSVKLSVVLAESLSRLSR
jgi:MoaA/NifB/PqqE/SkfB family radical SAM enzyme